MIKIKLRRNLIYLLIYFICAFLDYSVLGLVIPRVTGFNTLYICIYLYPIENIIGGLVVFLYQKYSIRKKEKTQYFGIKFNNNKNKGASDGKFKIILLVFFAAYFNFYRFIFYAFVKNTYINFTMDLKLTTIQIIISTIICIYAFEFKFKKHHKISLIIISIFLFLSMSTDIIYIIYYKFRLIKVPVLQYFIIKFNKNKGARDGKFKKILLVFFAAYFNFYRFIFYAFNRNIYINATMDLKLTTIQIIISTIICIYAFEYKFKKHHKISLIIISIFLFLSISTDIIYIL